MSKNNLSKILYKRLREKFSYLEEDKIKRYVKNCNSLFGKLTNLVYYSNLALDIEHSEEQEYYSLLDLKEKVSYLKEKSFFAKFYLD